ncbi:hypothetical protein [Flavobacterium macacae]|uniref:hypothetical protein n=1 Tax=Flavobacterium macacae TaxID=2488993 RepID=UPI001F3ACDBF|nr:hypothetical protein [Flavobacterium macacae]
MKQLAKTKVTVRLRKAEDRKEWYVYIESYPVEVSGKNTPQRIREYLNRSITSVEWDKNRVARTDAEGVKSYKPKRNDNGIIICRSESDREIMLYADAVKAHEQFLQVCELMSIPQNKLLEIRKGSNNSLEENLKVNKQTILEKKSVLEETQEKMFSVEEKWIKNEISKDTYERWYSNYSSTILSCKGAIERLSKVENKAFSILQNNLDMLGDVKEVYLRSDIMQKREFVKLVFDSNLYYQEGIYRTPTMMDILSVNYLKMKEKGLLNYQKKRDDFSIIPASGVGESRTPVQTSN